MYGLTLSCTTVPPTKKSNVYGQSRTLGNTGPVVHPVIPDQFQFQFSHPLPVCWTMGVTHWIRLYVKGRSCHRQSTSSHWSICISPKSISRCKRIPLCSMSNTFGICYRSFRIYITLTQAYPVLLYHTKSLPYMQVCFFQSNFHHACINVQLLFTNRSSYDPVYLSVVTIRSLE